MHDDEKGWIESVLIIASSPAWALVLAVMFVIGFCEETGCMARRRGLRLAGRP